MEKEQMLKLARQARLEDNSEDAKKYYGMLRDEDATNGEAKFFYAYYSLYEGKNAELRTRFSNLCSALPNSIDLIYNSTLTKLEKLKLIEEVVNTFVPETWSLNRYMNQVNNKNRVGNTTVTVFDYNFIASCSKVGMNALKQLGDQLISLYPNDVDCQRLATVVYKEFVSLAQKWYAYVGKGEAETYAAKIKAIDPSYEMPKKAGCISFGNKK